MSFIKDYIEKNASSVIKRRAKDVRIISSKDTSKKSVVFTIDGNGGTYRVVIKNYESKNISSSCSCPYDWGGLCKHEVACLLALDKKLKIVPPKKKGIVKKGVLYIPLSSDSTFNKQLLNNYSSSENRNLKNGSLLSTNVLSSQHIEGKVLTYRKTIFGYFDTFKEDVSIINEENNLQLVCSCEQHKSGYLCEHLYMSLNLVLTTFGTDFFSSEDVLNNQKIETLENEGIELSINKINKYYDFNFVENEFVFIPKTPQIKNISTSKDRGDAVENYIENKEIEKYKFSHQDAGLIENSLSTKYTIAFVVNVKTKLPLILSIIKGKEKSNGTIGGKLETIETFSELKETKALSSEEASEVFSAFKYFEFNELKYRFFNYSFSHSEPETLTELLAYTLTELRNILPVLNEHPLFEVEGKMILKNLVPIQIKDESSDLVFDFVEKDDFYILRAYVLVNGKKYKLTSNRNIVYDAFTRIDNVFYIHRSVDYQAQLDYFTKKPEITIFKEDFDSFYKEFLTPLQKKYKINYKIPLVKKMKTSKNKLKKNIYISELNQFVIFKPTVLYPQREVELFSKQPLESVDKDGTVIQYSRQEKFENEFIQEFVELHPKFKQQSNRDFFYLDFEDMIKEGWFFDAFEKMRQHEIEVFGLKNLKSFKYNPNKPKINTNVKSGIDWFEVDVSIAFGDTTISINDLKKAIVKKENFIRLGDGSLGVLPKEWIKKYERLFRTGKVKNGKLEVPKLMFSVVDELFENMDAEDDVLKEINEKKEKLKSFEKIKNIKKPKGVKAKLRDYQLSGISWLNFLEEFSWGGCLADDMGLGKTLQIISFLKHLKDLKKEKTSLVVVPTSLIFNWQEEIKKFCPTLKYKVLYGTDRDKTIEDFDKYDLILTSYGVLVRDISFLKDYHFNYAILDESQAIKNPASQRYKAVRLIKANNRVALTGTPIENNTFDLYAQMTFLNPGLLGSPADFKKNYSEPIDKYKDKDRADELQRIINPFLLRRTKEQVAKELPPKVESVLYCEMESEQRKVYDAYRNKYRDYLLGKIEEDGIGNAKMYVLEGLLKLRQICDSPVLLSDEAFKTKQSAKIKELLLAVTEKTGNHKILIFSQFVSMLDLIKEELEKHKISYEYLTGKTRKRQEKVDNFQNNDDVRVFLISLKAGGTGLNLTAADYVYIVDPWWNPAVEAQAIDRCYRIGQKKNVMAYKMICKDTIEEKIIQYQQNKKQLASDLIKTDDSFVKGLTKNDIKDLFS